MTSHQYSANRKAALFDLHQSFKDAIVPNLFILALSVYAFVFAPINKILAYRETPKGFLNAKIKNLLLCLTDSDLSRFIGVFFLLIGMICAIVSFSFISKKKSVSFKFALTVDRRTLFKNRVIANFVLPVIMIALPLVLDCAINVHFFGSFCYVVKCAVFVGLEAYVYTIAGFCITTLAMCICKTINEGAVLACAFVGCPTVICMFIDSLCRNLLKGYNVSEILFESIFNSNGFSTPNLICQYAIYNPFFFAKKLNGNLLDDNIFDFAQRFKESTDYMGTNIGRVKLDFSYIVPLIIWAVICLAVLLIARRVFINIKVENSGIHGSSKAAQRFCALVVDLLVFTAWMNIYTLTGSEMFNLTNKKVNIAVGIAIMIVIHFIVAAVMKRTIKIQLKELIQPACTAALTVAFAAILISGGFGYADYVPNADNVVAASISTTATNSIYSELTAQIPYRMAEDVFSSEISATSPTASIGTFTDKDDINQIVAINKKLIAKSKDCSGESVNVIYKLKTGKVISRYYPVSEPSVCKEILSLRDSNEARKNLEYIFGLTNKKPDKSNSAKSLESLYQSYTINPDDAAYIIQNSSVSVITSDLQDVDKEIKNTAEFREALCKDLLSQNYESRFESDEKAIGAVNFDIGGLSEDLLKNKAYLSLESYNFSEFSASYFIYPSMINTVNYLESTGEIQLFDSVYDDSKVIEAYVCPAKTVRNYIKNSVGNSYSISLNFASLDFNAEDSRSYSETFKEIQKTCGGKTYTAIEQIREIVDKSLVYKYTQNGDLFVILKRSDGSTGYRIISADNAPNWINNK